MQFTVDAPTLRRDSPSVPAAHAARFGPFCPRRVRSVGRSAIEGSRRSACGPKVSASSIPDRTPIAMPEPASRAIRRSANVSPMTAVRPGGTRAASHNPSNIRGSGLTPMPSSPQAMADTSSRTPSARRLASVGDRSSVVATAIERPLSRRAPKSRGRSASGIALATGSGMNQAVSTACRAAATLGHQRRITAATTSRISPIVATASGAPDRTRPVVGSNPIVAKTSPATGRRVAPSSRVPSSIAHPPHIAWKSSSVPSLSNTTRSIPSSGPVTPRR